MHISVNKNAGAFMITGNWNIQKASILQHLSQLKNDHLKIETSKGNKLIKGMGIKLNKKYNDVVNSLKISPNGTGKGKQI